MHLSKPLLVMSTVVSLSGLFLQGCAGGSKQAADSGNPFMHPWSTPYQIPPFDSIKVEHYLPAFEEGIKQHRAEISSITSNKETPSFDNTIIPLEYSGELLNKVSRVFFALNESMNTPEMQEAAEKIIPLYTSYQDEFLLNDSLFSRINALYQKRDSLNLSVAQRRAVEDYYKNFTLSGALLSKEDKAKLADINSKLASQYIKFNTNLLNATNEAEVTVQYPNELEGLPQNAIDDAAVEAQKRGNRMGAWVFSLQAPSRMAVLQYAKSRDLRRRMWKSYTSLASSGKYDNTVVIDSIVRLRSQKAKLLGFKNFASLATAPYMAKTPEAAKELLMKIWRPATAKVAEEVKEMQAYAKEAGDTVPTFEPWDYYYYAEKVRNKKYNLNENAVKEYFAVDSVKKGLFKMAEKLYGITFTPLPDAPKYHPDVEVYDVKDASGKHLAVWMCDYFPRETKRQGAWMDAFDPGMITRDGKKLRPIIYNVGNLSKPSGDVPALLTIDDVETMFHEFGHALHGMLTQAALPSQVGTSVDRDFVEFPSQLHEHWAFEPALLKEYANHYSTGFPIPDDMVSQINASRTFNQGFAMTELVGAALLDLAWGELNPGTDKIDVQQFENTVTERLKMPKELTFRYRSPYFKHIFGDEGYASGYYTYLWAAVLECDGYELFKEKGPFDKESASKLKHILESGGSEDAMKLYEEFRGHRPQPEALLKARGLQ